MALPNRPTHTVALQSPYCCVSEVGQDRTAVQRCVREEHRGQGSVYGVCGIHIVADRMYGEDELFVIMQRKKVGIDCKLNLHTFCYEATVVKSIFYRFLSIGSTNSRKYINNRSEQSELFFTLYTMFIQTHPHMEFTQPRLMHQTFSCDI